MLETSKFHRFYCRKWLPYCWRGCVRTWGTCSSTPSPLRKLDDHCAPVITQCLFHCCYLFHVMFFMLLHFLHLNLKRLDLATNNLMCITHTQDKLQGITIATVQITKWCLSSKQDTAGLKSVPPYIWTKPCFSAFLQPFKGGWTVLPERCRSPYWLAKSTW